MTRAKKTNWLLLIHQIPPKPDYFRVKIWRRLQQVGAVALKQSVYVLPLYDHLREDFNWILKEIIEGGGDGSIVEACFLEGLGNEHVVALFQNSRGDDYEKIIQEANQLLTEWSSGRQSGRGQSNRLSLQVARLQRRLEDVMAIDFFSAPQRGPAELLLNELTAHCSAEHAAAKAPRGASNSPRFFQRNKK